MQWRILPSGAYRNSKAPLRYIAGIQAGCASAALVAARKAVTRSTEAWSSGVLRRRKLRSAQRITSPARPKAAPNAVSAANASRTAWGSRDQKGLTRSASSPAKIPT